ncbi:MAG: hypothetical protein IJR98_00900 [Synergistaceae bacterium]|nr:hypothetical protein [Synergistaceae bacterium]
MYTGNGVTKNFPIPEGYDGKVVILRMPGGKGIRMAEGESYEVKDGCVCFYAAVPAGIEILFDELSDAEMMSKNTGNYLVIYGNGTISEVDEDPLLILAEAKRLLGEAKQCKDEAEHSCTEAAGYVTGLTASLKAELKGLLDGYKMTVEEISAAAAAEAKSQITTDWADTLERIAAETKTAKENRYQVEKLLEEARQIAVNTATSVRDEIALKCEQVLKGCETLDDLKTEINETGKLLKNELEKTYYDVREKINITASEELEMLKSLRLKLEDDYSTLSAKINARWEFLRGELDE